MTERGVEGTEATRIAEELADHQWSMEDIESDYYALSEIESRAGTQTADDPGKVDPTWNDRVKFGIELIREERYKVRRETEYEAKQDAKAKELARARARGLD